jgi:hypothetical protein
MPDKDTGDEDQLRGATAGESRVERALPDSVSRADPSQQSLETDSVTPMGSGSVFSLIREPVVRIRADTLACVAIFH